MLGTLLAHMIELIAGAAIASIQLQYATYQMQQAAGPESTCHSRLETQHCANKKTFKNKFRPNG